MVLFMTVIAASWPLEPPIACAIVQEHFEGNIGFECVGAAFQYAAVGIDPDKVKPVNGILRKKFPELIRKTGIDLFLDNPFTYLRERKDPPA